MKLRVLSDHTSDEINWPQWIPMFAAIVPTAIALEVAHQRDLFTRPRVESLLLALVVVPYLLDFLDAVVPFRVALAPWLFSAFVIVPTTILLLDPTVLDFLPFFFVFLTAEMASRLERTGGVAVALACAAVMIGIDVVNVFDGSFIWCMGILAAWFAGFAMHHQLLLTSRLQAAQSNLAEKAAADERSRIAREVHDVIAHSMSVSMLHISAARMALEKGDGRSTEALESLREAERQGRRSLSEIRRTVGLLGVDGSAGSTPMPTATDLPGLVTDLRNAGVDVTLTMDGDVQTIPPAAGLGLYRIVQESLTNVAKHAPGQNASVSLNVGDRDITLRVHNTLANGSNTSAAGAGLGLPGMAQRAALLGGTFAADADDGGWTVLVRAPRVIREPG